jgi:hypothetical protein
MRARRLWHRPSRKPSRYWRCDMRFRDWFRDRLTCAGCHRWRSSRKRPIPGRPVGSRIQASPPRTSRRVTGTCRGRRRQSRSWSGPGTLAGRTVSARRDQPAAGLHRQPVPAALITRPRARVQETGRRSGADGPIVAGAPTRGRGVRRTLLTSRQYSLGGVDYAIPKGDKGNSDSNRFHTPGGGWS